MSTFHQKPNTFVQKISLNVMNMERSLQFYKELIGFQVLEKTAHRAILSADGTTPLMEIVQPENVTEKEKRTTGLYHFALLLPTRKDLANFVTHLLEKNYRFGASDHLVSEAIYIDDPDGNGIEIYRDRPAGQWEWKDNQVTMVTEPLDGESLLSEKDGEWTGLPAKTLMGHIHLHVSNLEETEKFYRDGLGFEVVTRYPGALFMATGKYHHHLGLNIWNGEGVRSPAENSVDLNWYTIVFPTKRERDEKVNQLNKLGIEVEQESDKYMTRDPSGNEIHLIF